MCRWCAVPLDSDPDPFDGRQFLHRKWMRNRQTSIRYRRQIPNVCSGMHSEVDASLASDPQKIPTETRDIVANGMVRFEGIGKTPPPQPDIEQLSPRVINILGMNPSSYTLNGTNCYLVGTGPRRILIDAGESREFGGKRQFNAFLSNVEKALRQAGCTGLDMIIVTHLHADHWGASRELQARWGPAPIAMLPAEPWTFELYTMRKVAEHGILDVLRDGPSTLKDGKYDPNAIMDESELPEWPNEDLSWDVYGRSRLQMQKDFSWCEVNASFYNTWYDDDGSLSLKLQHGQVIRTEGATLRVMHAPGHSSNHIALALDEEQALFSGDHVLGYGTTEFEDLHDYMATLEAMRNYQPSKLYPGHGPYIADGTGLLERYIKHRQKREDQIVACFGEESVSATQVADMLYTNTSKDKMNFAINNVETVMVKLWREGRVKCYGDATKTSLANLPDVGYVFSLSKSFVWELLDASTLPTSHQKLMTARSTTAHFHKARL